MASASFTAESGRNQFLQLFATQLQNQDPLEPTKQEDFLLQLAQFSMVEGVENTNTKLDKIIELQSAEAEQIEQTLTIGDTAWLGKQVAFLDAERRTQTGLVTGVEQKSGEVLVQVGEQSIPVSQITGISEVPPISKPAYDEISTATALLGKTVKTLSGYTGVINSFRQIDGQVKLFSNERSMSLSEIQDVLDL